MIEQNGLPRPRHTADVLHMALQRDGRLEPLRPEPRLEPATASAGTLALVAGGAYAGYRLARALWSRP